VLSGISQLQKDKCYMTFLTQVPYSRQFHRDRRQSDLLFNRYRVSIFKMRNSLEMKVMVVAKQCESTYCHLKCKFYGMYILPQL
jgi:hypothetical protein